MDVNVDAIETEFDEIFKYFKEQKYHQNDIQRILTPLRKKIMLSWMRKYLGFVAIFFTICLFIYYIDFLNWHFSAVGRLLMMRVLPFWNWKKLYNARCLVSKDLPENLGKTSRKGSFRLEDCYPCENLEKIDRTTSTNFSFIRNKYLISGNPTIVQNETTIRDTKSFIGDLLNNEYFINSNPCDLKTNLALKKYATLENIFTQLHEDHATKWFLQLRNCELKASRSFVQNPSFYPRHVSPYSTWILMSNNYNSKRYQEIFVHGMIIVRQLKGNLQTNLKAKELCYSRCGEHDYLLKEGESLVFLSDLWTLSYKTSNLGDSITVISETDFTP